MQTYRLKVSKVIWAEEAHDLVFPSPSLPVALKIAVEILGGLYARHYAEAPPKANTHMDGETRTATRVGKGTLQLLNFTVETTESSEPGNMLFDGGPKCKS